MLRRFCDISVMAKTKVKCQHLQLTRTTGVCKECDCMDSCAHRIVLYKCEICARVSLCKHGRRGGDCIPCGGKSVCHHKRRRATCKECVGNGLCVHLKQKYQCMECKGILICEHKRQFSLCKLCRLPLNLDQKSKIIEQSSSSQPTSDVKPCSQVPSKFTRISMASLLNNDLNDAPRGLPIRMTDSPLRTASYFSDQSFSHQSTLAPVSHSSVLLFPPAHSNRSRFRYQENFDQIHSVNDFKRVSNITWHHSHSQDEFQSTKNRH